METDDRAQMTNADFERARGWFLEGAEVAGPEYRAGLQLALAFMRGQRAGAAARDEELRERRSEGEAYVRQINDLRVRTETLEAALRHLIEGVAYAAPEELKARATAAQVLLEQDIPF